MAEFSPTPPHHSPVPHASPQQRALGQRHLYEREEMEARQRREAAELEARLPSASPADRDLRGSIPLPYLAVQPPAAPTPPPRAGSPAAGAEADPPQPPWRTASFDGPQPFPGDDNWWRGLRDAVAAAGPAAVPPPTGGAAFVAVGAGAGGLPQYVRAGCEVVRRFVAEWTRTYPLVVTARAGAESAAFSADAAVWRAVVGAGSRVPPVATPPPGYVVAHCATDAAGPVALPAREWAALAARWPAPSGETAAWSRPHGHAASALSIRPNRHRALLIGINYTGRRGQLSGCINDVKTIQAILRSQGFGSLPDSVSGCTHEERVLVDDPGWPGSREPNKAEILAGLDWLAEDAAPGDTLFISFSGHGGQVRDVSGDEVDGYDETLCPLDYQTRGQIVDDDVFSKLVAPLPAGVRMTAVMDCCHSGTVLDLPFIFKASEHELRAAMQDPAKAPMRIANKRTARARAAMHGFVPEGNILDELGGPRVHADVVMFSGCSDEECSMDVRDVSVFGLPPEAGPGGSGGACTNALAAVLHRMQGNTMVELLDSMRRELAKRNFSQVPQLTTSRPVDLSIPFSMFGPLTPSAVKPEEQEKVKTEVRWFNTIVTAPPPPPDGPPAPEPTWMYVEQVNSSSRGTHDAYVYRLRLLEAEEDDAGRWLRISSKRHLRSGSRSAGERLHMAYLAGAGAEEPAAGSASAAAFGVGLYIHVLNARRVFMAPTQSERDNWVEWLQYNCAAQASRPSRSPARGCSAGQP